MAQAAFEELVEDFEFLDDWEDRYRLVIEEGKAMVPLDPALKVPATKVEGCASQVWLHAKTEAGVLHFDGESDAMIVNGLIAVLRKLYNGLPLSGVLAEPAADLEVGEVAGFDAVERGVVGVHVHVRTGTDDAFREFEKSGGTHEHAPGRAGDRAGGADGNVEAE